MDPVALHFGRRGRSCQSDDRRIPWSRKDPCLTVVNGGRVLLVDSSLPLFVEFVAGCALFVCYSNVSTTAMSYHSYATYAVSRVANQDQGCRYLRCCRRIGGSE